MEWMSFAAATVVFVPELKFNFYQFHLLFPQDPAEIATLIELKVLSDLFIPPEPSHNDKGNTQYTRTRDTFRFVSFGQLHVPPISSIMPLEKSLSPWVNPKWADRNHTLCLAIVVLLMRALIIIMNFWCKWSELFGSCSLRPKMNSPHVNVWYCFCLMFADEQGPFISRAPLPTIGETQEVKSSNEVSLDTLVAFVCHNNYSSCLV